MKVTPSKQFKIGIVGTTLILSAITLVFILMVTGSRPSQISQDAPTESGPSTPIIKNTSDLDAAAKQLDSNNVDSLDQNMNSVAADVSTL